MTAESISTNCKPVYDFGNHGQTLTVHRRFNTHVSALFVDNMALREQFVVSSPLFISCSLNNS